MVLTSSGAANGQTRGHSSADKEDIADWIRARQTWISSPPLSKAMLEVFRYASALTAGGAGATCAAATPAMDRCKARLRCADGRIIRRGACSSGKGQAMVVHCWPGEVLPLLFGPVSPPSS